VLEAALIPALSSFTMPEKDETCDALEIIEVAGAALKLPLSEETKNSLDWTASADSKDHSCEVLSSSTFKPASPIRGNNEFSLRYSFIRDREGTPSISAKATREPADSA
jgi:hypothetical protein